MMIEFSVIIPTYNRANTLDRAIVSVLNQSLLAKEVIVVDDGSLDNTVSVISSYSFIKYFFQENKGVCAARNRGAKEASGEWLVFLDSDDELLKDALFEFANYIIKQPDKLVFTGGFLLNQAGVKKEFIPAQGKYIGQVSGSFAIQRSLFLELGGYDTRLKFAENTELFFRIKSAGYSPALIPIHLMCYHQLPTGSNNNLKNVSESILLILEIHQHRLPRRIKRLYNQILAVNFLRFRQFSKARKHFFTAYKLDVRRLDTLGRLFISFFPPIARKVYSENPNL